MRSKVNLFNGYLFGVYYVPDTDMHHTIDDSSRQNKKNICLLRPHMWGKQTVNKQVNDGMSDVVNFMGKNKARFRGGLLNWVAGLISLIRECSSKGLNQVKELALGMSGERMFQVMK